MRSAYLLVSHGSRDPRPQAAMEYLAKLLCQLLFKRDIWVPTTRNVGSTALPQMVETQNVAPLQVGTACLELAHQPLHEQIKEFGDRVASDCKQVQVLPLFLLPGVHVKEDIPKEVASARQAFGSDLTIDIRPHVGEHPGLAQLLANQLICTNADARILLSHGSRRVGGNQPVEAIAATLGAVPAYWSVSPSLESQLKYLVAAGCKHIDILPYFLFHGGITDAIAQSVARHRDTFPSTNLHLAEPMGASAELAELIWDLTQ